MKNKIVEIITSQLPIVGNWREQYRRAEKLADEILALYQDELDACEHYRQLQAESLETLRQPVGEPDHLCPKCGMFDCLQHGYAIGEEW